jgi:hypothetical protein
VRVQKIVEELHVELIVLHDQDGPGHSAQPRADGPRWSCCSPGKSLPGKPDLAPRTLAPILARA